MIKFDNTEILNSTYIPRYVKHESAPERILDNLNLAREDGRVFIVDRYDRKEITIIGNLTGSSVSDLEQKIDAFKELFSRVQKNLDIDFAGGTRRYIASVEKHDFDRDYFNDLYVPWFARFIVLSGEGKDTTPTSAYSNDVSASTPTNVNFTLLGSKPPKPKIKLTLKSYAATAWSQGLEILNNDTGERILLTKPVGLSDFGTGNYAEFDFELKKILNTLNGTPEEEIDYYGSFSKFLIGLNSIKITDGGLISQETPIASSGVGQTIQSANTYLAQSFQVPRTDETYRGIELFLSKVKATTISALNVNIKEDLNGEPKGSTIATIIIPEGEIGAVASYVRYYASANFTLEAGKTYWIVINAGDVSASNYYVWYLTPDIYNKGFKSVSQDTGSSWTDDEANDFLFKIIFGGRRETSGLITVDIDYYKTYL